MGIALYDHPDVRVLRTIIPMTTTTTRQLVLTRPSDYFGAGNALLLCLNAEGFLLHHFFLTQEGTSPLVMQACVTLAKGIGACSLVRVQAHQACENDPVTGALRETARLYGLRFVEANPSEFTH